VGEITTDRELSGERVEPATSAPPTISFTHDIIGVVGVTLLVAMLMWPVLDGSRTLTGDSWHYNYPWAVEGTSSVQALSEAVGEEPVTGPVSVYPEPYVLAYDVYLESIPWYAFAKSELLSGRWPHWNPRAFNGAPLYANHLVPVTHPPLLIALLVAPVQQINTVCTFLTWWLGGLGLYFYLRRRRLSPISSLAGVTLYLSSGHYMPLVPFQMSGVMYLPWLLLASDMLEDKPSIRNVSFFAIVFGLQASSGHTAFVVPFIYFIALYRILGWVFNHRSRSYWLQRAGWLILAFVLGGLISAIQNYPTWEFLKETPRGLSGQTERSLFDEEGLEPQKIEAGIAARPMLSKFFDLIVPVFVREIEVQHKYIGIPLILLAIMGLILLRPPPERLTFIALFIIFGILAIRPAFNKVAYLIPGLGISPFTPYEPAQMIGFILAATGIDALSRAITTLDKKWTVLFSVLTVLFLAIFTWLFVLKAVVNPETRWASEQIPLAIVVLITGIIGIAIPSIALLFTKRYAVTGGFILPLIITVGGVIGHLYQYPVFPLVPVMPVTTSMQTIPDDGMYRVIRFSSGASIQSASMENPLTFGGNLPMWAGYLDSQGYDSFVTTGQWNILKTLEPESLVFNGLAQPLTRPESLVSPILDAMAVKYVIADDPDLLERYEVLLPHYSLIESRGLIVYERTNALPRWYLTDNVVTVASSEGALEMLTDPDFRLSADGPANPGVIIESEGLIFSDIQNDNVGLNRNNPAPGRISRVEENPQRIEFRVVADRECLMVLSDVHYPEWHASIDGESTEILKANSAYRAVLVPSGEHTVVFHYDPASFRFGALVTVSVLLILILFSVVIAIFRKTKKISGNTFN